MVLKYGALNVFNVLKSTHICFCKKLQCVSSNVTNHAVLGELGTFSVGYIKKCISYLLKLVTMGTNRYHRKCYDMLLQLHNDGKNIWILHVKRFLYTLGCHLN